MDAPPPSPPARPSLIGATFATWFAYAVPLTMIAAIALAPLVITAARLPLPVDPATANAAANRGWALLGLALLGQLILVGGAAAIARAQPAQLRALAIGVAGLGRAVVPCLTAAAAVAIAGLALAVPGLIVLVLVSLTAASPAAGARAAVADSLAVARANWRSAALAVTALVVVDAVIGVGAFRMFVSPLGRPPSPAQLAGARNFVRALAIALVAVSALPATALALIRVRADR